MTLKIANLIGTDIRTRRFFRNDMERILPHDNDVILDFSGVIFVSRSVADEIYNLLEDYPRARVCHLEGDVAMMYSVVHKGRRPRREYEPVNAKVVNLKSIEDLMRFFESQ